MGWSIHGNEVGFMRVKNSMMILLSMMLCSTFLISVFSETAQANVEVVGEPTYYLYKSQVVLIQFWNE